jgi:hypothetical protein
MSYLDDARQALQQLHDLTMSFGQGGTPDPHSVLACQSRLVRLYSLIAEERTKKFGAKESAYLARKIQQAKQYQKGRITLDGKRMMSAADATEAALLAVGDEFQREIDTATEFELYGAFLKSIQNALDYGRQVTSTLKRSESNLNE